MKVMVKKFAEQEEDLKARHEEQETRERQERRIEAARQRWIKMLRLPEEASGAAAN
jgi:hypothetical protein